MTKLNSILLFVMMIGVVTINFMACKEPPPVDPPPVEPPDTTQYFLENTKWKLIAFVDNENNTTRPYLNIKNIINDDMWYTLDFLEQSDSTDTTTISGIVGTAEINDIYACYNVNYNNSTVHFYEVMQTGAYLLYENDESNFFTVLWGTKVFEITKNHLKIFYNDKKNHLLFERRQ